MNNTVLTNQNNHSLGPINSVHISFSNKSTNCMFDRIYIKILTFIYATE